MDIKMDWYKAIDKRTSRRTYEGNNISEDKIDGLKKLINEINNEASLNLQFIEEGKKVFDNFKSTYGLIKGAKSFIALVGNSNIENVENKIGYYGEFIVLEATNLGLGTCWLGGTYDKEAANSIISLNENENMYCIIAIGNVQENKSFKEKLVKGIFKNRKSFDKIFITEEKDLKGWVKSGMDAVIKAPSAINKQPWLFNLIDNKISVTYEKENTGYEKIDVGISMAHFELGTKNEGINGKWHFAQNENTFFNL